MTRESAPRCPSFCRRRANSRSPSLQLSWVNSLLCKISFATKAPVYKRLQRVGEIQQQLAVYR